MAIYRATKEQIDEYYALPRLNQSAIKVIIEKGIQTYLDQIQGLIQTEDTMYYEEKDYFIVGKGVDCRVTEGEETFNKNYHISTIVRKPGATAMSILKSAFDKAKENFPLGPDFDVSRYRNEIHQACNEHEYYVKRAKPTHEEDSRIDTIIKDNGAIYWGDMYMAGDKQILSDQESNLITTISNSLLNHNHTKHLFEDSDSIDIVYQFPVHFSYLETECKGLLDMIIINHTKKRIMPIDVKTMNKYILDFYKAINERRYDLQGSFYNFGLKANLKQLSTLIKKDISSYEVSKFAFIVESTKKPGTPLVFVLSDELLNRGRYGEPEVKDGVSGWVNGVLLYKAWQKKDFSIDNMFEDTNGVVFVDENLDYTNFKL